MDQHENLARGFRLGDHEVHPTTGVVRIPSGEVRIEPRVMDVLVHLARRSGHVVSMQELLDQVWGGRPVVDGAVVRCISALRKLFGDTRSGARYLETIPKRGYRLLVAPTPISGLHRTPQEGGRPRLAVLPFQNLSGSTEDEIVSDGVTELLISALARLGGWRVISRTSVMRFRAQDRSLRDIAAALGVDYVIEGSVLRSGSRLQIVVQLIDAATDEHVWADTLQRELGDLLRLQNELTRTLARQIRLQLAGNDGDRLAAPSSATISNQAMQAYLQGLFWFARRTGPQLLRAIEKLREAAHLDPHWEQPWGALAVAHVVRALYGEAPPAAAMPAAGEALQELLRRNPTAPEAWHVRGAIAFFYGWRFDDAESALRRAIGELPSEPMAHLVLGDLLLARGRFDDAISEAREALELSPLDVGLNMNLGDFLFAARRTRDAARQLTETLELEPSLAPARVKLAWAHATLGEVERADGEVAKLAQSGGVRFLEANVLVDAVLGRRERIEAHFTALEALQRSTYVSPWTLARCYAITGRADVAFVHLEQALEERASSVVFLAVNPAFDSLRTDPRYATLLTRIGLN